MRISPISSPFSVEFLLSGDKSISHRALIFSALSSGRCEIQNFSESEDCIATLEILKNLGIRIDREEERILIYGNGGNFIAPKKSLYCGNSGTTMRLMAGLLSSYPFKSTLEGDVSLSSRPMGRIILPLEKMGASFLSSEGNPPLQIQGSSSLNSIAYDMPIPSAQVKSAILLAGLRSRGETLLSQPMQSRNHTECMLKYYGVQIEVNGLHIKMQGGQKLHPQNFDIPGDISSAAFWIVAGAIQEGARVKIKNVGLNPTRITFLNILKRMGAEILIEKKEKKGEMYGDLSIFGKKLSGTKILKEEVPYLIDEIPILMIAGLFASGETSVRNAKELRFKESDRINALAQNFAHLGADFVEYEDGISVRGGKIIQGGEVDSFDDHRIAMSFSIAGLFSEKGIKVKNAKCISISYPSFVKDLKRIQSEISL